MKTRSFTLLALFSLSAQAQTPAPARLAVIGDLDQFEYSQPNYCGDYTRVQEADRKRIGLTGGEKLWFKSRYAINTAQRKITCTGEYSFVPQAGETYIIRFTETETGCLTEGFQTVKGGNPFRIELEATDQAPCFLQRLVPAKKPD
jgi:hypothetical protein